MEYLCPTFRPHVSKLHYDSTSIQVIISPLEKNFGSSYANMLRRTVLRYTPGMGITGLRVNSIPTLHMYSSLPGVKEHISEILTNLKALVICSDSVRNATLLIKKKGPCFLRGHDIICPDGISITNKDLYLCTLEYDNDLDMELYIELGCGYVSAKYHGYLNNTLFCDTVFSPIKHVSYYVRSYTTYEELIFYIKTSDGCDPFFALKNAFIFLNSKMTPTFL